MENNKSTIEKVDTWNYGYNHSTYVRAASFIYTCYHVGMHDETGRFLNSIEEQTEQCFKNLSKTLGKAGATLDDVVKMTVYLRHQKSYKKKQNEFRRMDNIYSKFFTSGYPVRMGIWTSFFHKECYIQLEAVAYKP